MTSTSLQGQQYVKLYTQPKTLKLLAYISYKISTIFCKNIYLNILQPRSISFINSWEVVGSLMRNGWIFTVFQYISYKTCWNATARVQSIAFCQTHVGFIILLPNRQKCQSVHTINWSIKNQKLCFIAN
jgi:hypothetical protein